MTSLPWILFLTFVAFMLFLDLGVFNKKSHVMSVKEALGWTFFWIVLALAFNVMVYSMYENRWGIPPEALAMTGEDAAMKFLTAYIVEKSLSMDNLFVITMIFGFYKIPVKFQHRVLFWGILGALVMRGVMIVAGTVLIQKFHWMIYVFGVFLIFTAIKMLMAKEDENKNLDNSKLVKIIKAFIPFQTELDGEKFFVKNNGKTYMTPMFLVLLIIEATDVLFAVDSIPAVMAVTTDPFIVFTSNIFAILGLRSLYFALAAIINQFKYLKYSIIVLLAYVGVKMILSHIYPIPTGVSLAFIFGVLSAGIGVSVAKVHKHKTHK